MLYVLLYKVLKSYWLGFLLSTNAIHTPFLSSNPRVLGFIVNGEHIETVSKQRYRQNPFRRYSRTSVNLCRSSGGYTRTHTHKAVQDSLGFFAADARHLWQTIQWKFRKTSNCITFKNIGKEYLCFFILELHVHFHKASVKVLSKFRL